MQQDQDDIDATEAPAVRQVPEVVPSDAGADSGLDADDGLGFALFQIEEPEPRVARGRSPGRGIGIDLGTTNSVVAIAAHGDSPRAITAAGEAVDRNAAGATELLVPSVVAYVEGRRHVGTEAIRLQALMPSQVVASAKRFIGRGIDDIRFLHPYRLSGGIPGVALRFELEEGVAVTPVEVSAEILRELSARAREHLGGPPAGAVITVPAYFDDAQRQATKDAARLAGLEPWRLLAEPTAAALAYGLDQQDRGIFLVYDLGGGTFDVSVLRLREGVFQVLAIAGDSALGGDDFDRTIVGHWLASRSAEDLHTAGALTELEPDRQGGLTSRSASSLSAKPSRVTTTLTPIALQKLLTAARRAKEELASAAQVDVDLQCIGAGIAELTRAQLDGLCEPLVRKTIALARKALSDASVELDELDGVVLVGGSTRMLLVRELLKVAFGREPMAGIDPDLVVAHGAAISADLLSGSQRPGVTLLDVVPLSLGLETMGGIVERVIPRNATIPIAARQVFTNYSEAQTAMTIHVVQGEREMVADCRSLARFELKGLPRLAPGMARVEVTFQLDADALLTVSARELSTGVRQQVEVRATYGLSDADIEAAVDSSMDFAALDFALRNRAEEAVELSRVILAATLALDAAPDSRALPSEGVTGPVLQSTRVAVGESGQQAAAVASDERSGARSSSTTLRSASISSLVSDPERAALLELIAAARAALAASTLEGGSATDVSAIATSVEMHRERTAALRVVRERLERATEPLARRRMERALLAGMRGRSVDQLSEQLNEDQSLDERRGGHGAVEISLDVARESDTADEIPSP